MLHPLCKILPRRPVALSLSLLLVLLAGEPIRARDRALLAQENTPAPSRADALELLPGKSLEREITGGDVHAYKLAIASPQYVELSIAQTSTDVVVALFGPNGQLIGEANANGKGEFETISGTFGNLGTYRIEVRPVEKNAAPGRYEITLKQLRSLTQQDKARFAADRIVEEGIELYKQGTAESKKQAIARFQEAAKLYKSAGELAGEARAINLTGFAYSSLGEKQTALEYYQQSLPLYRAAGEKSGEAVTLDNIGSIYAVFGDYQQAIDYHQQALPLFRAANNPGGEAVCLNQLGTVYKELGEKQQALEYFNQSLQLFRSLGNQQGIATLLDNIASVYSDLGEAQKALEQYQEALQIWQALKNPKEEAINLLNIGFAYSQLKQPQQALTYMKQALALSQSAGDKSAIAGILNNIGAVYADLQDSQQALDYYNQSLPLRRAVGDSAGTALTLFNIALVERDRGNFQNALTKIEEALEITENQRAKVASQELRTVFFASKQSYYEFYIDLLMQLHKQRPSEGYDAKALFASERARARSLLELLAEAGADIRTGADPKLLEQEKLLQKQLNNREKFRIQLLSGEHTGEQEAAINKEIEELLGEYRELQAKIRTTSPHYAALTQPQPLTLKEIQQQVLDENTLLLEYSLGEKRSYLWAVSKTGIASYELPKRADIEAAAKNFITATTSPTQRSILPEVQGAAAALSEIIIKPAAGQLGQKRLLVVSDGALQYIPFAALSVPGKPEVPLVIEHEIVNLPSASTLAILRRETEGRAIAPKTLAAIADPIFGADDERIKGKLTSPNPQNFSGLPVAARQLERAASDAGVSWNRLPFTRKEAEAILALVPETERSSAFDFAANRAIATSDDLSQYRIIHFATHGFANSENPELSGIVMSLLDEKGALQNGYLRLHDIFNLDLNAELVVLSACQTGLGKEIKGEGLVGLTRGFMYAGAPRVVVSLWSVNDEATSELMVRFYKKMLQDKLAPAAALRAAQIELLQQTEWKSPYYWAAFELQGEWK